MASKKKSGSGQGNATLKFTALLQALQDPYGFSQQPCAYTDHANGKNHCAGNPNCMHGWIGQRKGIWSSEPRVLSYGLNPAGSVRNLMAQPAGLRNLGATCYLAALVQVLYSSLPLRAALMAWQPRPADFDSHAAAVAKSAALEHKSPTQTHGSQHESGDVQLVVQTIPAGASSLPSSASSAPGNNAHAQEGDESDMAALQRVFALLNGSVRGSVVDAVRAFVDRFKIEAFVQQDTTEFFMLMMGHFESILSRSTHLPPVLRNLMPWLFEGRSKRTTVCKACGWTSEREETWEQQVLPMQGMKSLEECILAELAPNVLEGDNAYECERCKAGGQGRQTAVRMAEYTKLPRVLFIMLARFSYDNAGSKIKLRDRISIPDILDLGALSAASKAGAKAYLEEGKPQAAAGASAGAVSSASDCVDEDDTHVYALTALVYHLGNSPAHGHYVADVWDQERCGWWHIDDDSVEPCSSGVGDGASAGSWAAACAGSAPCIPAAVQEKVLGMMEGGKPKNTFGLDTRRELAANFAPPFTADSDSDDGHVIGANVHAAISAALASSPGLHRKTDTADMASSASEHGAGMAADMASQHADGGSRDLQQDVLMGEASTIDGGAPGLSSLNGSVQEPGGDIDTHASDVGSTCAPPVPGGVVPEVTRGEGGGVCHAAAADISSSVSLMNLKTPTPPSAAKPKRGRAALVKKEVVTQSHESDAIIGEGKYVGDDVGSSEKKRRNAAPRTYLAAYVQGGKFTNASGRAGSRGKANVPVMKTMIVGVSPEHSVHASPASAAAAFASSTSTATPDPAASPSARTQGNASTPVRSPGTRSALRRAAADVPSVEPVLGGSGGIQLPGHETRPMIGHAAAAAGVPAVYAADLLPGSNFQMNWHEVAPIPIPHAATASVQTVPILEPAPVLVAAPDVGEEGGASLQTMGIPSARGRGIGRGRGRGRGKGAGRPVAVASGTVTLQNLNLPASDNEVGQVAQTALHVSAPLTAAAPTLLQLHVNPLVLPGDSDMMVCCADSHVLAPAQSASAAAVSSKASDAIVSDVPTPLLALPRMPKQVYGAIAPLYRLATGLGDATVQAGREHHGRHTVTVVQGMSGEKGDGCPRPIPIPGAVPMLQPQSDVLKPVQCSLAEAVEVASEAHRGNAAQTCDSVSVPALTWSSRRAHPYLSANGSGSRNAYALVYTRVTREQLARWNEWGERQAAMAASEAQALPTAGVQQQDSSVATPTSQQASHEDVIQIDNCGLEPLVLYTSRKRRNTGAGAAASTRLSDETVEMLGDEREETVAESENGTEEEEYQEKSGKRSVEGKRKRANKSTSVGTGKAPSIGKHAKSKTKESTDSPPAPPGVPSDLTTSAGAAPASSAPLAPRAAQVQLFTLPPPPADPYADVRLLMKIAKEQAHAIKNASTAMVYGKGADGVWVGGDEDEDMAGTGSKKAIPPVVGLSPDVFVPTLLPLQAQADAVAQDNEALGRQAAAWRAERDKRLPQVLKRKLLAAVLFYDPARPPFVKPSLSVSPQSNEEEEEIQIVDNELYGHHGQPPVGDTSALAVSVGSIAVKRSRTKAVATLHAAVEPLFYLIPSSWLRFWVCGEDLTQSDADDAEEKRMKKLARDIEAGRPFTLSGERGIPTASAGKVKALDLTPSATVDLSGNDDEELGNDEAQQAKRRKIVEGKPPSQDLIISLDDPTEKEGKGDAITSGATIVRASAPAAPQSSPAPTVKDWGLEYANHAPSAVFSSRIVMCQLLKKLNSSETLGGIARDWALYPSQARAFKRVTPRVWYAITQDAFPADILPGLERALTLHEERHGMAHTGYAREGGVGGAKRGRKPAIAHSIQDGSPLAVAGCSSSFGLSVSPTFDLPAFLGHAPPPTVLKVKEKKDKGDEKTKGKGGARAGAAVPVAAVVEVDDRDGDDDITDVTGHSGGLRQEKGSANGTGKGQGLSKDKGGAASVVVKGLLAGGNQQGKGPSVRTSREDREIEKAIAASLAPQQLGSTKNSGTEPVPTIGSSSGSKKAGRGSVGKGKGKGADKDMEKDKSSGRQTTLTFGASTASEVVTVDHSGEPFSLLSLTVQRNDEVEADIEDVSLPVQPGGSALETLGPHVFTLAELPSLLRAVIALPACPNSDDDSPFGTNAGLPSTHYRSVTLEAEYMRGRVVALCMLKLNTVLLDILALPEPGDEFVVNMATEAHEASARAGGRAIHDVDGAFQEVVSRLGSKATSFIIDRIPGLASLPLADGLLSSAGGDTLSRCLTELGHSDRLLMLKESVAPARGIARLSGAVTGPTKGRPGKVGLVVRPETEDNLTMFGSESAAVQDSAGNVFYWLPKKFVSDLLARLRDRGRRLEDVKDVGGGPTGGDPFTAIGVISCAGASSGNADLQSAQGQISSAELQGGKGGASKAVDIRDIITSTHGIDAMGPSKGSETTIDLLGDDENMVFSATDRVQPLLEHRGFMLPALSRYGGANDSRLDLCHAIRCEHGGIRPDKSLCRRVHQRVYHAIRHLYGCTVDALAPGLRSSGKLSEECCETCSESRTMERAASNVEQDKREGERRGTLAPLLKDPRIRLGYPQDAAAKDMEISQGPLAPGTYRIVPRTFLQEWRNWQLSKGGYKVHERPTGHDVFSQLQCDCCTSALTTGAPPPPPRLALHPRALQFLELIAGPRLGVVPLDGEQPLATQPCVNDDCVETRDVRAAISSVTEVETSVNDVIDAQGQSRAVPHTDQSSSVSSTAAYESVDTGAVDIVPGAVDNCAAIPAWHIATANGHVAEVQNASGMSIQSSNSSVLPIVEKWGEVLSEGYKVEVEEGDEDEVQIVPQVQDRGKRSTRDRDSGRGRGNRGRPATTTQTATLTAFLGAHGRAAASSAPPPAGAPTRSKPAPPSTLPHVPAACEGMDWPAAVHALAACVDSQGVKEGHGAADRALEEGMQAWHEGARGLNRHDAFVTFGSSSSFSLHESRSNEPYYKYGLAGRGVVELLTPEEYLRFCEMYTELGRSPAPLLHVFARARACEAGQSSKDSHVGSTSMQPFQTYVVITGSHASSDGTLEPDLPSRDRGSALTWSIDPPLCALCWARTAAADWAKSAQLDRNSTLTFKMLNIGDSVPDAPVHSGGSGVAAIAVGAGADKGRKGGTGLAAAPREGSRRAQSNRFETTLTVSEHTCMGSFAISLYSSWSNASAGQAAEKGRRGSSGLDYLSMFTDASFFHRGREVPKGKLLERLSPAVRAGDVVYFRLATPEANDRKIEEEVEAEDDYSSSARGGPKRMGPFASMAPSKGGPEMGFMGSRFGQQAAAQTTSSSASRPKLLPSPSSSGESYDLTDL